MNEAAIEQPRRPGRPSNAERDARAQQQRPAAHSNGRREVLGRDGKVRTRKRTGNTDPFAIPPHIIPDGWDYQWNPFTITGQPAIDSQIAMAENGWEPVPADRHDGMFMPVGSKGQIVRGGLRLEERPLELTLEAREEDRRAAVNQLRDQQAQFGLGDRLGRGMEERRFVPGGARQGLDAATDAPKPRYEIAD